MGLSLKDLPPATLQAGEIIQYYSQMFTWGDKRGLREAVVLRVNTNKDYYPVYVDTNEVISQWSMIRKVPKEGDDEKARYWRKVHTYELIDGESNSSSRAKDFNAAIRNVVSDVLMSGAASARLHAESSPDTSDLSFDDEISPRETSDVTVDAPPVTERSPRISVAADKAPVDEGSPGETGIAAADGTPTGDGDRVDKSSPVETNNTAAANTVQQQRQLHQFVALPKDGDRWKRQKRANPKNTGGWTHRSKKRGHQKQCKPSRDSKHVRHANDEASSFLRKLMQMPHMQEALIALRREHAEAQHAAETVRASLGNSESGADVTPPQVSDVHEAAESVGAPVQVGLPASADEDGEHNTPDNRAASKRENVWVDKLWPSGVKAIVDLLNPHKVTFKDAGEYDPCECVGQCYSDTCLNSRSDTFCTPTNCKLGGYCNNSLLERRGLKLFQSKSSGLGVRTSVAIDAGVVIGQYVGELQPYKGIRPGEELSAQWKHNSGYSFLLSERDSKGRFVYIEPQEAGGLMRFCNHSCDSNCTFRQVKYRAQVRVVVMTVRAIEPGEEITVRYGDTVCFPCTCGSPNCISKKKKTKAKRVKRAAQTSMPQRKSRRLETKRLH